MISQLILKSFIVGLVVLEVARGEELEMPSWLRETRQEIGVGCRRHSDCGDGARCIIGSCQCLDSHIQVEGGKCLRKLAPGQTPCFRDEQCQAAWPSARCVNTMCQCTQGSKVRTRDGIVCVSQGTCPLGGAEAALKDTSGRPVTCEIDSRGYVTGCSGQLHMYDCITTNPSRKGQGYCCPNKAATCSMPANRGSSFGGSSSSWHYNSITGECGRGAGGSANSFTSKQQCENYCASCPRGNTLFKSGADGLPEQFVQREQTCDPKAASACPDYRFDCNIIRPGKALCCPSREFICGPSGGAAESANQGRGFDEGIPCGPQTGKQQRYYFDATSRRCLTFQYAGCGGNFNNFVSQDDCMKMCSPNQSGVGVGLGSNVLGGGRQEFTPPPYEPSGNGGGRGVQPPVRPPVTSQGVSGGAFNNLNDAPNNFAGGSQGIQGPQGVGNGRNQLSLYSVSDAFALGGRPNLRIIENGRLMGGVNSYNNNNAAFTGDNQFGRGGNINPQFGQQPIPGQNPFPGGPSGGGVLPWNVNHNPSSSSTGLLNSFGGSSNGLASNSVSSGVGSSNPLGNQQIVSQPLFTPLNLQSLAGTAMQYEAVGPKAFGPRPWYASG